MPLDTIYAGSATNGDVGERLLAANFDAGALRPFRGSDGRNYVTVNNQTMVHNAPATLRHEDWLALDRAIIKEARPPPAARQ